MLSSAQTACSGGAFTTTASASRTWFIPAPAPPDFLIIAPSLRVFDAGSTTLTEVFGCPPCNAWFFKSTGPRGFGSTLKRFLFLKVLSRFWL
jgi:hypothetical protein